MQKTLIQNQQFGIAISDKLSGQPDFLLHIHKKKSQLTTSVFTINPLQVSSTISLFGSKHQFLNCLRDESKLKIDWNSQILEIHRGGKNISISFQQAPITHIDQLIDELSFVKKRMSQIQANCLKRDKGHFLGKQDKISLPMLNNSQNRMVKDWQEENQRVYRNMKTIKRKTEKDEMIEIQILREGQNIWNMKFLAIVKEKKFYKCLKKDLSLQKYREFFGQSMTSISTFYKWIEASFVSIENSKLVAKRENEQIMIPLQEQLITPLNVTQFKFRQMLLQNQEQIKSLRSSISKIQLDCGVGQKNIPLSESIFESSLQRISERVQDFQNEMQGFRCSSKFLNNRINAFETQLEQFSKNIHENSKKLAQMRQDQKEIRISTESMEQNELVILNNNIKKLKRKVDKQDSCLSKIISYLQFFQRTIPPVNFKSAYAHNFKIFHNQIQYIAEYDDRAYQILGLIPIRLKNVNKFSILVTEERNIFIGIINQNYFKDRNSSAQEKRQCILYFVNDGDISVSGHYLGDSLPICRGCREGETLTMKVIGSTISWEVNQEKRGSYSDVMISNPSIPWVPFIMMMDKGDKILWD